MDYPEGTIPCPECHGKGYVKCEHPERGEHNDCLECGYDFTPDLIEQAKQRIEK